VDHFSSILKELELGFLSEEEKKRERGEEERKRRRRRGDQGVSVKDRRENRRG